MLLKYWIGTWAAALFESIRIALLLSKVSLVSPAGKSTGAFGNGLGAAPAAPAAAAAAALALAAAAVALAAGVPVGATPAPGIWASGTPPGTVVCPITRPLELTTLKISLLFISNLPVPTIREVGPTSTDANGFAPTCMLGGCPPTLGVATVGKMLAPVLSVPAVGAKALCCSDGFSKLCAPEIAKPDKSIPDGRSFHITL